MSYLFLAVFVLVVFLTSAGKEAALFTGFLYLRVLLHQSIMSQQLLHIPSHELC